MQDLITITAILPNHNYAHHFQRRLQEILAQTQPISELIILDDASTDGSQALIKKTVAELKRPQPSHPAIRIQTSFNARNSGNVFAQWQKGIELATSDLIWICELDDSASPDFLQAAVRPFIADQDVVLSYVASKIIDDSGRLVLKDNLRRPKDFLRRHHAPGSYIVDGLKELNQNLAVFNSIPNVSAAVIKNLPALPQILNAAQSYHLSGDWYFYIELAKLGKIAYTARSLSSHRLHQSSVTQRTNLKTRFLEMQAIHQYAESTVPLTASTRQRIAKLERQLARRWSIH